MASQILWPKAMYLASIIDMKIILCLLLLHIANALLKKKLYLITNFLSLGFLA